MGVWSVLRASAYLIAGMWMRGFAHEDRAGHDAAIAAFRDPYRPAIRELIYISTPCLGILAAANPYSPLQLFILAPVARMKRDALIVFSPSLCRILDVKLPGTPSFQAVW